MSALTPPYRPAVAAGDLWFVSGQIGIPPEGEMPEDFAGQCEQVLANLDRVLTEHGLRRDQVVKVTVFLTDMADYAALNERYRAFFTDAPPARSAIAVAALPFDALVELEAVVHAPSATA